VTRDEAIRAVVDCWRYVEDEWCGSDDAFEASQQEMFAALSALGVTNQDYVNAHQGDQ
jgi:hypothetical protein